MRKGKGFRGNKEVNKSKLNVSTEDFKFNSH